MPVFPGAKYEPIPGHSDGPMRSYLGLVLHVNDANSYDLHDYFSRADIEVSSHFQVTKDGRIFQYLDTDKQSWCQSNGNKDYLSVETQGFPSEALTEMQVSSLASLYRWLHETHYLPYRIANTVGSRGFAWHGMGGDAWGGHPGCPGDLRKAQRSTILTLAQNGDTGMASEEFTTLSKQITALHEQLDAKADARADETDRIARIPINGNDTFPSVYDELNAIKASLVIIENKLGL